ncbi:MAG: hypothetical protein ACRC5T_13510, partial [Cetobacterium sp.]
NHWVAIEAYNQSGTDVARGKPVSGTGGLANGHIITNGSFDSNSYASSGAGANYVQIDLGAVFDVYQILILRYNIDLRTYNGTTTLVSENGSVWYTIYNYNHDGLYPETPHGIRIYLNHSNMHNINTNVSAPLWTGLGSLYRGGSYIRDIPGNKRVPTSGAIDINSLRSFTKNNATVQTTSWTTGVSGKGGGNAWTTSQTTYYLN